MSALRIVEVDPQGEHALGLLREAAIDARALYPQLHRPDAPWPTNAPTPPRGVYCVAYDGEQPVGMGAHRPVDGEATELRRMYVLKSQRRSGVAATLVRALEQHAAGQGFTMMVLETGYRQQPAMRLYESLGYARIPAFGDYRDDPTSVCYQKPLVLRVD